ncbi:MAG: hypothetical protein E7628_05840 [Ruminococcaceae bacterium]|nr:hypothetical protein [Oscillospiraceae bacterium]
MKNNEIFEKRYLTRVAAYALTAVVAIGVMIFLGYHVVERFSPGLELIDAVPTTVTRTIEVDGYIMRDEEPLYANTATDGSVVPAVPNGGRIAVGSRIVDVYSESSADIELRLSEIDEQIALLTKSKAENRSVQSAVGIESEIYDTVTSIRKHAEKGNYADALSLRVALLVDIKKKDILTGVITDYDAQISQLQNEKSQLRSTLGRCLETVFAGESGYYFSEYDGYGNVFDPDKLDEMTYDEFTDMLGAEPFYSLRLSIGTLVHSYTWYVICPMSRSEANNFEVGKSYFVDFSYSDATLSMKVERVINDTTRENSIVVYSSEKMPLNFDYTRMQPVSISVKDYTGFKIPVSAVRVIDGYQGVYVKDEVTIEFRRINVIYEDGGYVICTGDPDTTDEGEEEKFSWIKQNDIVVVSGTELYSGKVVR